MHPLSTAVTSHADTSSRSLEHVAAHPDAVRRRLEYEARRSRQAAERQALQDLQGRNMKWFEGHTPDNMVLVRTPDEYRQLLNRASEENRLLVAKFFTEDCYTCKSLHPKLKSIASDNPDVLWACLNGADNTMVDLFNRMGITKVPYFHMIRDGQLVSELTASLSPEKLARFRAELAAHKPQAQRTRAEMAWLN